MTDLMKIALSSADYPIWKDTISLPAGSTFQYKYLKKTASGDVSPSGHDFLNNNYSRLLQVIWESDPNRNDTVPSSGSQTLNDSWR